jgi:hypothetical protein
VVTTLPAPERSSYDLEGNAETPDHILFSSAITTRASSWCRYSRHRPSSRNLRWTLLPMSAALVFRAGTFVDVKRGRCPAG